MIGWVDGSAGASGDMLLGALVGAGVDIAIIQSQIDLLGLEIVLRSETVQRGGLAATKVHVDVPATTTVRHLPDIVAMFGDLDDAVAQRAIATFERLAVAEAAVHDTSVDDVHFHEVGALDSIADIVGVCAGFVHLSLDALHCSTLALGNGQTRGAHGPIPVPAPAVLALMRGIGAVESGAAPFESTTPTGAALLAEWVTEWGPMPAMTVSAVASGAGGKDSDIVANATRLVLGEGQLGQSPSVVVVIDANIDDLDPRVWPRVMDAALGAGALDAWVTPIVMKKGRPAHTFSAMCHPGDLDAVRRVVFTHTSTIGLRERRVERTVLDRREASVVVDGQTIAVKLALLDGVVVNRSAEWEHVLAAAALLQRPEADVLAAANAAMRDLA